MSISVGELQLSLDIAQKTRVVDPLQTLETGLKSFERVGESIVDLAIAAQTGYDLRAAVGSALLGGEGSQRDHLKVYDGFYVHTGPASERRLVLSPLKLLRQAGVMSMDVGEDRGYLIHTSVAAHEGMLYDIQRDHSGSIFGAFVHFEGTKFGTSVEELARMVGIESDVAAWFPDFFTSQQRLGEKGRELSSIVYRFQQELMAIGRQSYQLREPRIEDFFVPHRPSLPNSMAQVVGRSVKTTPYTGHSELLITGVYLSGKGTGDITKEPKII